MERSGHMGAHISCVVPGPFGGAGLFMLARALYPHEQDGIKSLGGGHAVHVARAAIVWARRPTMTSKTGSRVTLDLVTVLDELG